MYPRCRSVMSFIGTTPAIGSVPLRSPCERSRRRKRSTARRPRSFQRLFADAHDRRRRSHLLSRSATDKVWSQMESVGQLIRFSTKAYQSWLAFYRSGARPRGTRWTGRSSTDSKLIVELVRVISVYGMAASKGRADIVQDRADVRLRPWLCENAVLLL
jgi:hypothetical protein